MPIRRFSASKAIYAALVTLLGAGASLAHAETIEFGGEPLGSNSTPPLCQITYPPTARQAFFIQWNCSDDVNDPADITTELWISRPNDVRYKKVEDFLGFPASIQVDETLLGTATISEGLPLNFRLIARASAGATSISPVFTVAGNAVSLRACDLSVITEATASTGTTTGVPSSTVLARNVAITTQAGTGGTLTIRSTAPTEASTCEIDSLCQADAEITLTTSLTTGTGTNSAGSVTGSLSLAPGEVTAEVSGTTSNADGVLSSVDVRGTTTIDGATAEIRLVCRNQ